MIDQLKTIGIEKDKPFNPDARTQEILNDAAREAHAWLDHMYEGVFLPSDTRKTDNELSYGFNLLVKIPDRSVVKSYQVTSTATGYERVTIVSCPPSTMRNYWLTS